MKARLVVAAVLLAASATAAAETIPGPNPEVFTYANAGISADLFETYTSFNEQYNEAGPSSATVGLPTDPAYATASSTFGTNRALGQVIGQLVSAGGFSFWTDRFTRTGGAGTDTANVSVSLTGTVTGAAVGVYALLASANPLNDDEALLAAVDQILLTGETPAGITIVTSGVVVPAGSALPLPLGDYVAVGTPAVLTGSYSFEYGTPFYLASLLGAVALVDGTADFSGTAIFGITAPGIGDTGSGTIYLAAVPEPGTWAMLLAGLAVAGWVARRRA